MSDWQAARYPVHLTCGLCHATITIALHDGGPTTRTTGHTADCCQVNR